MACKNVFQMSIPALPGQQQGNKAASKTLQVSEELTFNDHEIDSFLPKELRKSSS